MPKLQPSEREQAYRVVRACIIGNQQLHAVDDETLSIKMHRTVKTVQNRRDNPGNFTLDELQAVARTLKLTPLQCASIVMGRPLTSKEVKEFLMI